MVNTVDQVHDLIQTYYEIRGTYEVNPYTLKVTVQGDVAAEDLSKLHVQFDEVHGQFRILRSDRLTSLEGAPRFVHDYCYIDAWPLTHLKGAPVHVNNWFRVRCRDLISLEHLPMQGARKYFLPWNPQLPMLRLLEANQVQMSYALIHGGPFQGQPAMTIMDKYVGKGKGMMLNCALELKAAGYAENAKW